MSLNIDTIQSNKSVFNPNPELNSTENYGIWNLTEASISYGDIQIQTDSFFMVTEYYQMRPDLISAIILGDQGKMGSLLKFNGIGNPFAIDTGVILSIPSTKTISDSFSSKKNKNQKNSNTNTNPAEVFRKNQEKKKFQVSEGRKKFLNDKIKNKPGMNLPPNVLQPDQKVIDRKNGFLIFSPDSGGGGFNKPTN